MIEEPPPPVELAAFTLDFPHGETPVAWTSVFGNDHPVELEIGSGKGLFLANAAAARPRHNFLGVEMSRKYAQRAIERVAGLRRINVRVVVGDARQFVARFVPTSSLRAVHVYFPDPGWKARHKKRRVFGAPL